MSKQQMIEAIQRTNRSADPNFLDHFQEDVLQTYLTRLSEIHNHRGPDSIWVRPEGPRAVATKAVA